MRTAAVVLLLAMALLGAGCKRHYPTQFISMTTPEGNHEGFWSCKGDAVVTRVGNRFSVEFTDEAGARIYRANLTEVVVQPQDFAYYGCEKHQ